MKFIFIVFLLLFYTISAKAAEKILPVIDGMTIKADKNSLQLVKIRVKSFGPGFCGVFINFAGKNKQVSAPPLSWSDWIPLDPAIAGGTYTLGFTAQCDTGALGEVKFH